jgi:hypothetical protein
VKVINLSIEGEVRIKGVRGEGGSLIQHTSLPHLSKCKVVFITESLSNKR